VSYLTFPLIFTYYRSLASQKAHAEPDVLFATSALMLSTSPNVLCYVISSE